ncbi:MAG: hypothetical protein ACLFSF_04205 [Desulfonatronovibrio sp.]
MDFESRHLLEELKDNISKNDIIKARIVLSYLGRPIRTSRKSWSISWSRQNPLLPLSFSPN